MFKYCPILPLFLLSLFVLIPKVSASTVFETYYTPESLQTYKEYLGRGTGTQGLYKERSRSFSHKSDRDYNLKAVALFIHTWDDATGQSFRPEPNELYLRFSKSGNSYNPHDIRESIENFPWGITWQVTFMVNEAFVKEEWQEITAGSTLEQDNRYKLWIAYTDYNIEGLIGEQATSSASGFLRGPISVFFEGGEQKLPTYRPVVLIHGLGGHYSDWEIGGNKEQYKKAILAMYDADPSGFKYPDYWVHAFNFGEDNLGRYRYQGGVYLTAERLHEVVENLHQMSVNFGGDGLVDIVGYSLGGIVAREYLRQEPENYVGKIITIASPHQGSELLAKKDAAQFYIGPIWAAIVDNIATDLIDDLSKPDQPLDTESMAVRDIIPGSLVLNRLNGEAYMPKDGFYTIGSNIKTKFDKDVFFFSFTNTYNLGDLLISKTSSLDVPLVQEQSHLLEEEVLFERGMIEISNLKFAQQIKQHFDTDSRWRYWHLRLIQEAEVLDRVIVALKE